MLKLILAMLIFGTIGIFRKMIPLSSAQLAFFRGAIGSVSLVLLVSIRRRKILGRISRKNLIMLITSGAMIGVNWILLFEAYNYTTVSVATLCYYMAPTFVVVLSAVLFREPMSLRKGLCVITALLGMVLISGVAESGLPGVNELRGIFFGLAAACLYAAVVLENKRIQGVDGYDKTILQLGSAALVLVPYLAVTDGVTGIAWTPQVIILLLFVGIVHTGFSYALYFGSIEGVRTQTLALLSYIDPVTALILSALLLHEKMTVLGLLGACMILGAAIVSERETGDGPVSPTLSSK